MGNLNCAKKREEYKPVKPLPPPPSDALRHQARGYYGCLIYPTILISMLFFATALIIYVVNDRHKDADPVYDLIDYLQSEAGNPMKISTLVFGVGVSSGIMLAGLLCGMATICSQSRSGIVGFAVTEVLGFVVVISLCVSLLTAMSHYGADASDKLDVQCSSLAATTTGVAAEAAGSSELQAQAAAEAEALAAITTLAETTYFPPEASYFPDDQTTIAAASVFVPPVAARTAVETATAPVYVPPVATTTAVEMSFNDATSTSVSIGSTTDESFFSSGRRKLEDSNFLGKVCPSVPDETWCEDQASTLRSLCGSEKPFEKTLLRTKVIGYTGMAGSLASLILSFVLCCFAYEVHTNKSALDVIVPGYLEDYDHQQGGGKVQWGRSAFSGGTARTMGSPGSTYATGGPGSPAPTRAQSSSPYHSRTHGP